MFLGIWFLAILAMGLGSRHALSDPAADPLAVLVFSPEQGESLRIRDLTGTQGSSPIIIVVSTECDACESYIKVISTCGQKVQEHLQWVSMGEPQVPLHSPMGRSLHNKTQNVYFAKKPKLLKSIFKGTPVTLAQGQQLYGVQTCSRLEGLLK